MKNLKWIVLFMGTVLIFAMPLTIRADEDKDEHEMLGVIGSRPAGISGEWQIGNMTFTAGKKTKIKQENGPLQVGACAKVKYRTGDSGNNATTIKSEEPEKCGQSQNHGHNDKTKDRDHEEEDHGSDGSGDSGNGGGGNSGGGSVPVSQDEYIVIGWNDLGMHCMDPSFEDFSVLPPFNTLWAQVIKRGPEPKIVTSGVTVEYSIVDNTESASKTNFWDYAQQLFNLPQPLPPNVGLRGFGLSGEMEVAGDHFAAEGIPLTEYTDSAPTTPNPYQVAELVVKDTAGNVLATTRTVAPVSTEMHCEHCHNDGGKAAPGISTGVVKQNILTLHDQEEGTTLMDQRPVLCAGCHSSNALGTPGSAGIPSLSAAMHGKHQHETNDCYQCHPGPQTKCLRGTMAAEGMQCQDCHGNISDVANPARNPWLDEPQCGDCHGDAHAEDPGKLYRFSTGHGGVYCQACHGSQHAVYPTNQPNDNIQSMMLQGKAGTIKECEVCHTGGAPSGKGPHGERANSAGTEASFDISDAGITGDVNSDGQVDILDLVAIVSSFGSSDSASDVNRDGTVDILDVSLAAGNFNGLD
ncbi:MAG: hypothetical protein D6768_15640 [Chloroflexi bacterium]|nr:MAG: hypothetical protein D6768_15640 [Chloroflexota bacterium]